MILKIKEIFNNNPLYKLVNINQFFLTDVGEDEAPGFTSIDLSFKEAIAFAFLENTDLKKIEIVLELSGKEKQILRLSKCMPNPDENSIPLVIMEEEIMKGKTVIKKNDVKVFFGEQKHLEIKSEKINTECRDFIYVSSADKIDLIKVKNIVFCKADGRYSTFFTSDGKKYVASKNLGEYEKELNSKNFFRIHKSYIVNINFVVKINKKDGISCELLNGMSLPVSSRKQTLLYEFLGLKPNNINPIGFPEIEMFNHI